MLILSRSEHRLDAAVSGYIDQEQEREDERSVRLLCEDIWVLVGVKVKDVQ